MAFLVAWFLGGCSREEPLIQKGPPPASTEKKPGEEATQATREIAQIKPGDVLIIKIYPGEEFRQPLEIEVNSEGDINVPLLNQIHVGEMTPAAAEQHIAKLLDQNYIVNPSVSLRIKEYHIRTVVVLGEVKRPGTYEFPPNGQLTLMKALALAGGFTDIAAMDRVHLIRKHSGAQSAFQINVKNIINGKQEDVEVEPDDLITVPETFF